MVTLIENEAMVIAMNPNENDAEMKKETSIESECSVCIEKFTKTRRKKITCSSCSHNACLECTKTYLLGSADDPHCMNCRKGWDRESQYIFLGKGFVNGAYRQHQKDLLFEHQKSLLPITQPAVNQVIRKRKLEYERDEIRESIKMMKRRLREIEVENYQLNRDGLHDSIQSTNETQQQLKCPKDGCKGYIDKKECGLCKSFICRECLVLLPSQSELEEHECDKETKETAQLILKSSKPCPTCGMRISKVSGCDQMWCPECEVAFSWRTGQKVHGVVHNPHYYEYMQRRQNNGGNGIRNPGDVACGGLVRINDLYMVIEYLQLDPTTHAYQIESASEIHRMLVHVQNVLVDPIRRKLNVRDHHLDKRVMYMMNELSEDSFRKYLTRENNRIEADRACLQIYEMLVTVGNERVRNFVEMSTLKSLYDFIGEMEKIREFVITEITKMARNFNMKFSTFYLDDSYFVKNKPSRKFCFQS